MSTAQNVIKRQKSRLADSEKSKVRAEKDLTEALQLIRSHEEESKVQRAKIAELNSVATQLRRSAKESEREILSLQDNVHRLQKQVSDLRKQNDNDEISRLQKEVEDLRAQSDEQKASLHSEKHTTSKTAAEEDRERWELDKRRQKTIDGLKGKVKALIDELEKANQQIVQLKETNQRLDRERGTLTKKMKRLEGNLRSERPVQVSSTVGATEAPASSVEARRVVNTSASSQDLQAKMIDMEGTIRLLRLENTQMKERLNVLSAPPEDQVAQSILIKVLDKADIEAKRRLESENENFTLAFQLEKIKADLAASKAEVEKRGSSTSVSNIKYMELRKANKKLKEELAAATAEPSKSRIMGDGRQIAKLSSELERVKNALKRERETLAKTERKLTQAEAARAAQADALNEAPPDAQVVRDYRRQVADKLVEVKELTLERNRLKTALGQQMQEAQSLEAELIKVRAENSELHSELSAFDPQFFDEIEDLKYQHGVATDHNSRLQDELLRIAREHGIQLSITLPDLQPVTNASVN